VALLAVCGFAARDVGDTRARWFAGVLALFALLVGLGHNFPLYGLLYNYLPMFNKFRIPVMVLLLFQLGLAMAAAWGWGALIAVGAPRGKGDVVDKIVAGAAIAFAVLGLVALFGVESLRGGYVTLALEHKPQMPGEAARAAFAAFAGDLGKVSFMGLALVVLAWLTRRGRFPVGLASVVVLALLLVELWPVSRAVMQPTIGDPVARNLEAGRDDVIDWLAKSGPPGTFRVFYPEQEWFMDNRPAGFGIATVGGRHSAKTRLFQDLDDAHDDYKLPWLALMNARYWVFSRPVAPTDIPTGWYAMLRQVYTGGAGVVYEYRLAMPRAMVIGAWHVVADTGRAVIDSITAVVHNPGVFTYLASDPGIASGAADSAGSATITHYALHRVDVDVDARRPAVLRLADLYYPDWKVTVDGKPARLLRADHVMRAVAVPAGRHKVQFKFASASFTLGAWLSLASACAAMLLIGIGWWLERRPPTVPAVPVVEGEAA
jgi:hypothetical protein